MLPRSLFSKKPTKHTYWMTHILRFISRSLQNASVRFDPDGHKMQGNTYKFEIKLENFIHIFKNFPSLRIIKNEPKYVADYTIQIVKFIT